MAAIPRRITEIIKVWQSMLVENPLEFAECKRNSMHIG